MKLLFDENLSPRLVDIFRIEYPGSAHIRDVGLRGLDDNSVWDYAKSNDFVILSKDSDFRDRGFVDGCPPKIIWLDVGNVGTEIIVSLLRNEGERISKFEAQSEAALLILSLRGNTI